MGKGQGRVKARRSRGLRPAPLDEKCAFSKDFVKPVTPNCKVCLIEVILQIMHELSGSCPWMHLTQILNKLDDEVGIDAFPLADDLCLIVSIPTFSESLTNPGYVERTRAAD